jgi:hypothetical protein
MFCISINIVTAAMKNIYERLCWLYVITRSTLVCDAIGNSYPLSVLTELSENQIPYLENFVNQSDYGQKSILKDLQMKVVPCARTTGVIQGRYPATMAGLRDAKGIERFIVREGVPIIPYATKATGSINKPGWGSLGIVSSCLLLGIKLNHIGHEYLNPQTMAWMEIDFDSEEYLAGYQSFTKCQPAAIFQAQDQTSDIFQKSITDHKSVNEVREATELLVSMVEMAYGLPYKYDDDTTALQLIQAQLKKNQFAGQPCPRTRQARDDKNSACCQCTIMECTELGPWIVT